MLRAAVQEVMKPENALELMFLVIILENREKEFSYKQDREKN